VVVSRRRRGVLLVGLALMLGGLAAADVGRREAALARELGPEVDVVVAATALQADAEVGEGDLTVRRMPARYVPPDALGSPSELVGSELAVAVAEGALLTRSHVEQPRSLAGGSVRRGERAVEVVAAGLPELVVPGARVDVVITHDDHGSEPGSTELFLRDVEVLGAAPAPEAAAAAAQATSTTRVAATLRVTLRQALDLTAAQSFAREIRLLPRP
jgi:pilus assembly protein CpaB